MRGAAYAILFLVAACLVAMIAEVAFGAPPVDAIERAAADPDTSVRICTCVDGPLAEEIERLRTQVRLLRAELLVNGRIECAATRRRAKGTKR